jgi:hypothetical protein
MGPWRDRALPRAVLLWLAFAALAGHVCAEDAAAHHAVAAAATSHEHSHPAGASGLHAASCQGLKPDPTGTVAPAVGAGTAPAAIAIARERSDVLAPPVLGRRSVLYLLHASLRL